MRLIGQPGACRGTCRPYEPLKGYRGLPAAETQKRRADGGPSGTPQRPPHPPVAAPSGRRTLLAQVRSWTLQLMKKKQPLVAWVVDDTGVPKKGTLHWLRAAVRGQRKMPSGGGLSVATWHSSLPIAFARELGAGSPAAAQSRRAPGSLFPNQTANRARSDSPGGRTKCSRA